MQEKYESTLEDQITKDGTVSRRVILISQTIVRNVFVGGSGKS